MHRIFKITLLTTKILKVMKNLANFISKIDENNFVDLYFVATRPTTEVITFESITFHDKNEAQRHCDYLNKVHDTNIYYVQRTSMHI